MKQAINIIVLFVSVGLVFLWGYGERSEKLKYKDNFEAAIKRNGQQALVTEMEFTELYSEIDSLMRELGRKPKNIIQVVKVKYQIKDTTEAPLVGDTVYIVRNDTVYVQPDTLRFNLMQPCYNLKGYVYNSRIKAELDYHDTPVVVFDREKRKKFLFIKYGGWKYSAAFYSQCSGKLMWIEDNILINRK